MTPAATPDLAALLRPFVGAKFDRLPQTRAVDILHRMNSVNATIVSVTDAGIEKAWGGFVDFIPWSDVQSVTIRSLAGGRTVASTTYQHDAAPVRKVAA